MVDEVKPGQTVGNICHALWPKSSIAFSLIVVTSSRFQRFNEYFSITKNGSIIAQKFVDRDNINNICGPLDCCQSAICIIHARVMFIVEQSENPVMHSHDQVLAHLQIHLTDINDNSPRFPLNSQGYPHFTIRIQEGAKFAREMLPSAVDLDSAGNGVVQYRIEANSPSADLFQLTYEKVLINPPSESHGWRLSPPTLIQLRELDYENPADREFELVVIAIDGGEPALTGSLSVTVVLMDINDNAPVFERTNISSIELAENTTYSPDPVYKFLATDMDSADNGLITYSLSPLNEPMVFEKFAIDGRSGALYLNSILDYEVYSERRFTVIVVASDNGTPKRSGTTTLTVVTKDVNDNLPSLVVQENITVIEGLNYTKPVVRFYVKDDDYVSRGKVICRPAPNRAKGVGSASLRLQEVTTNAYFVFTEGIFDYEEARSASVEIICSDSADSFNTRERILPITVAIGDANDHYPEFGVTEFLAKLPEHSPKGKRVVQVTASDADAGIHARLTYSLVSSNGGRCSIQEVFSIDSATGVVTVRNSECLDREVNEEIEAYVAAEDGGGLSTSAKLRIRLMDVNDNSPSIQVPDSLSVTENLPAGVVVGRVRCTDADIGSNAEIRLELSVNNTQQVRNAFDTISESRSARNSFSSRGKVRGMNDITGLLVTKKPLDREDIESYTIQFVATDSGNPQRITYKSVQVLVLDENDNVPILRFPQLDTTVGYHPQVYTNSPYGSKVCVLRSYDPDKGENGTVIYVLQHDTNGSRYFQLDQTTGELTTAWHHRGPAPGVYAVKILLYDMGQSPTKVAWNFFVYISPRNPLLDAVHLSKSSSTGRASNVTASAKSKSRLTHTTVIMISVAVLIVLILLISCVCMIKILLRSRAKSSRQSHNQRQADSMMKEPSTAMYSTPALNMVFTQAAPLIDNTLATENLKYTGPTPSHSSWCMKPFGQNDVVTQVTPDGAPVDGSAGSNYLFASLQTGCNTFSRSGYSSLWQNYPIS
ncbi:Protocadherin-1 [Taenia solium]|eukprot:TsM_000810500 transcript=TsM_000810500 gene=TsM_000810500